MGYDLDMHANMMAGHTDGHSQVFVFKCYDKSS